MALENGHMTVQLIAELAGVSTATVSRVLNNRPGASEKVRQNILRLANESGYRGAIHRNSTATLQIGLVHTRSALNLSDGYEAGIIFGVYRSLFQDRLRNIQAQMVLTDISQRSDNESISQFFLRRKLDGIVLRSHAPARELAREIQKEGFPCVVLSDRFPGEPIDCVDFDSRPGTLRAFEHLYGLGHRRIAFVTQHYTLPNSTDLNDRFNIYCEQLKAHNIPHDPKLVQGVAHYSIGPSELSCASAIDQLLALADPPTAIMTVTPRFTINLIRRLQQRGVRIPEQMSVVGFDDINSRHSQYPVYSAICQDSEYLASMAVEILLDRLCGDRQAPVRQLVFPTTFEANQTTGPVRSGPLTLY